MNILLLMAFKVCRAAYSFTRFAAIGKNPHRAAILSAYLRLHAKVALCSLVGRPVHSLSFLGRKVHFPDPHIFSFLLTEIFIDESYAGCDNPPATILDLGSNIGMSILYFKSLWPQANVLGVEASPQIFEYLKQNVEGLPGVTVLNRAVSDGPGQIMFYSNPASLIGSTNSLRGGSSGVLVEALPFSDFVTAPVDLLKIDIEGAEIAAFAELESSGKFDLMRQMLIEYHHHLPGEEHSLSAFLARLERNGFSLELAAQHPGSPGHMQDILIHAWRPDALPSS